MTDQFKGFNQDFWQFFIDLKSNNNRPWFAENKDRYYDHVIGPMSAFISAIAPKLREISPYYNADPRPNKGTLFRIYRDARFLRGAGPYKEHAAAQFRHRRGKNAHAPGFYVHLEQGNISYGGGVWMPPTDVLLKIRERIAYYPEKWQVVLDDKAMQTQVGGIHGDGLTRPPRGFLANTPHIEDIKRKSFFALTSTTDIKITATPAFVDEVIHCFESVTPLMHFISDALDIEF